MSKWTSSSRNPVGDVSSRLGRALKVASVIPLAMLVVSVLAPAAWAHEATAKITCTGVVFHYIDFPNEPGNVVHEGVVIAGVKAESKKVDFNGSTRTSTIDYVLIGSETVTARARWNTNGAVGSFSLTQDLDCGGGVG
ncbi:MAG: hypothetical protein WAM97_07865 [Acidimicrobiales bacterium]